MQTIAVGTEKGAYFLQRNGGWSVRGPEFAGWKASAFGRAPDGTYLAGLGSNWFGASVHRSPDLEKWEQVEAGPTYSAEVGRKLTQVWTFHTSRDRILAGVDEAGLFQSVDQGRSWQPVDALNEHSSRQGWQPGFGGLCAHHILSEGDRIWVGISAVGVFRSDDGGTTFGRFDQGVPPTITPEEDGSGANGWCVHGLVSDPLDANRIWRQDHLGVFRTTDGGDTWERIETGLPTGFGFPIGRHHSTGTLFVVPLTADANRVPVEGRFGAFRSTNDGDSWQLAGKGWQTAQQFTGVLRNALRVDPNGGVVLGTTGGQVYVSDDVGDTWQLLPYSFPRILALAVF
ncbi:MAG: WD40/YVTN/BNR-like repeat-containing protein [Acidimicrobiia bacterium]